METRQIGSLDVSLVGLGCNNFGVRLDAASTAQVVDAAIDAGITFFDTADIYGKTLSEEFLGRALKGQRDRVIIATKFGMPVDDRRKGAAPAYVRQAAEDSLRRLDTDYIDLYQLHQPDASVPISDTLAALNELVDAGKVREIGCSNFSAEQLREAQDAVQNGAVRFVSVQNEYSLLNRTAEHEVLPACERMDIAFLPYFPLANGLLTGKYRLGEAVPAGSRLQSGRRAGLLNTETLEIVEALIQFSATRGHTILELAFSWLASHTPVASVIAGATSPEQIRANAVAVDWILTEADLEELNTIVPPETMVT
jgi:aryl-alcohol dehydrogenase-like predicted oxidoreductase